MPMEEEEDEEEEEYEETWERANSSVMPDPDTLTGDKKHAGKKIGIFIIFSAKLRLIHD